MNETYYGNFQIDRHDDWDVKKKRFSITPADMAFGHRFWAGQQPMEYLLEFLNVLAGYNYRLDRTGNDKYRRLKRLGLRRFVFLVDDRNRHEFRRDTLALTMLEEALQRRIEGSSNRLPPLEVVRQLLRSFSTIEMSRSWFAKALFPIHETFLMWEGYRKKSGDQTPESNTPADLDNGFGLGTRNFFGRSGEMVYLMLGAGTRNHPKRRSFIEGRLKLMLQANHPLGQVADLVEQTWLEVLQSNTPDFSLVEYEQNEGTLGWLPDPNFPLYERFSEDVEALLRCSLDPVEAITLLMHLVCFYVVQYLYSRSLKIRHGADDPRPTILIDALESGEDRAIRQASVLSFKRNQELLTDAIKRFLAVQFSTWIDLAGDPWQRLDLYLNNNDIERVDEKLRLEAIPKRAEAEPFLPNDLSGEDRNMVADMLNVVWDRSESLFLTNFLPAHRRLSYEIGLVSPRTGIGQRYILGDKLLKTLVLCNTKPGHTIEYYSFVDLLFERYGIVIGPDQVGRAADWLQHYDVNRYYYQSNLDAFRLKLKSAGLLTEYSDATGLVGNRTTTVAAMEELA